MKKSFLASIFIIILVVGLSVLAIVIGIRLRKEEEVAPEETEAAGEPCNYGSECPACAYPKVAFCNLEWNGSACVNGVCQCKSLPQPTGGCNDPSCPSVDFIDKCTPPSCPAGWDDCGTDLHRINNDPDCVKDGSCTTDCTTCGNKTKIFRYCIQEETTTTTSSSSVTSSSTTSSSTTSIISTTTSTSSVGASSTSSTSSSTTTTSALTTVITTSLTTILTTALTTLPQSGILDHSVNSTIVGLFLITTGVLLYLTGSGEKFASIGSDLLTDKVLIILKSSPLGRTRRKKYFEKYLLRKSKKH